MPDPILPQPAPGPAGAAAGERPFAGFAADVDHDPLPTRRAVTALTRAPEPACVAALLDEARLAPAEGAQAQALALQLAGALRARGAGESLVQGLIQEFALSSQEGVALMCLAEALLRIPDMATRDALIRDKIAHADWRSHVGQSPSLFVNAATWGLIITGKLVATNAEGTLATALARVLGKGGEPLVRRGVDLVMRMMGEQFVSGETIDQALARAAKREAQGFRHSYDMLGEAALTAQDAARYLAAYERAIDAIGTAAAGRGIYEGPGISIKLSALHPRYSRAQRARVHAELYPRLLALAGRARRFDIGLNIDAEEADRLELSLDLLARLCAEPSLAGWNGVGFVVQAYQKRCPRVIDELAALAATTRRRLMVRLVKGAYWDSEIKRAQVDGQPGYPVYTRKVHTDVAYLACARRLLASPGSFYPQFATHNAQTLAAIHAMAGRNYYAGQYEFQCLHGMGEALYEDVVKPRTEGGLGRPCRIYAPVGTHETLLAYLVRRLLENGANSSFVNRIADPSVPLEALVADPVATVERAARDEGVIGAPHPRIPLPRDLYAPARANSRGMDLADESRLHALAQALAGSPSQWQACPIVDGAARGQGTARTVTNPANRRDVVGTVVEAAPGDIADALAAAARAAPAWRSTPAATRAAMLERAADALEAQGEATAGLVVREAGRTLANAVGELREAVDFLRYYAAQARDELAAGSHAPGVVVAISPWNFPLAIFTGQVAAALAAGNAVIAKPAEQTPLVAAAMVGLLHAAGVPGGALQLLPGDGESVGAPLVADARVRGVVFTGSNAVAGALARGLAGRVDEAGRLPVLVAETGGQNAMIVDSSALPEQVVGDALLSAFDSAGQRCSALRILCLQEDTADAVLAMLEGALDELVLGDPSRLATDVGPMIDAEARARVEAHVDAMRAAGHRVYRNAAHERAAARADATFLAPAIVEIPSIGVLEREVFGPVLHVLRYRRDALPALVDAINATGFALTLGVHSRIDETIDAVVARARAGNVYVNRSIIGAVVGVQPFGGEGRSGTGPKAGGPRYLPLLAGVAPRGAQAVTVLPGPTGERNTYWIEPRRAVLCTAEDPGALEAQLGAVRSAGAVACLPLGAGWDALLASLPGAARAGIGRVDIDAGNFDAALVAGEGEALAAWCERLAARDGPIVAVIAARRDARDGERYPLERLQNERALSVNTAAAGGNASLMTLG